jgi:thiol-disulfide isomerase/thioredoxin
MIVKKLSALILILNSFSILLGQAKQNFQPFVLKGHLTNCSEKEVWIGFQDEKGLFHSDAATQLDGNGNFIYRTTNIKTPREGVLIIGRFGASFFAAPGYSLSLTGDADDAPTFTRTKKITGTGAETNRYRIILDSIIKSKGSINWYEIERESDFLAFVKYERKVMDSVSKIVFDTNKTKDQYYGYFEKLVSYDAMFLELQRMLSFINRGKCSFEESDSFLKKNFDNAILANPLQDKYLISTHYRDFCIEYSTYLVNMDYQKDSTLRNKDNYKLEKANKVFTGKTREFVISTLMVSAIGQSKSVDDLNNYKNQFKPYISTLKSQFLTTDISNEFSRREKDLLKQENDLLKVQAGMPAPGFTLESNLGKKYSLEDFKGKVVYLDLWASWCVPCRAENPKLKALYAKYKNDDRIAFISIAVSDGLGAWQKALRHDKPDWIQLFDKDAIVSDGYVTTTIPQFVIIDKQGRIVNLNGPRPGDVETLLVQEMEK